MPHDITALDATALTHAIHDRHLSCLEVMQTYLDRWDRINHLGGHLLAFYGRTALAARSGGTPDGHLPPLDGMHHLRHARGRPAISVPAGFDPSGRWPMGLQLIAAPTPACSPGLPPTNT